MLGKLEFSPTGVMLTRIGDNVTSKDTTYTKGNMLDDNEFYDKQ